MQAYRLETTVADNKSLTLRSLPFHAGELVEVIILSKAPATSVSRDSYPLRGLSISYVDPTEPVAQADWEVMG